MRQRSFAAMVLLVFGSAGILHAATLTWPGGAPCNTTLQACITGAAAGDTVQIASNGPIAESPTVAQSLTVLPAAGFTPVVNGFFFLNSTAAAADITLQGLTINGFVRGSPGAGNLSLHILNNTVSNTGSNVAIDISSGTFPPYGNVTSEIRGNTVTVTGSGVGAQCGGIHVGLIFDSGTSTGSVIGNTVTVTGCGQGDGILAINGAAESMSVDIIGNRVTVVGTNVGIELRNFEQTAGSLLTGRVINNLVTGQLKEAGFPGAIVVSADGFEPINAQVINNTVAGNDGGIGVSGRTDLGASITGVVANNIVVNNTSYGLFIDSGLTVTNNNNLVFGNNNDGFTPGPGTIFLNPVFVSSTDFHLRAESPAIGRGANAQVPGDITTDLDGAPRIQQAVVDIGAYESSRAVVASIPDLSLAGRLALMALLALTAAIVLRRA